MEKIVITSGVRTPIGAFGGSLKDFSASELATIVTKEAIKRSELTPDEVQEVIFGCVGQVGENAYLSRIAALKAGLPLNSTALTVNRLCSSGLQSIVSGVQSIQTGMANIVVAGGAESMSNLPFLDYERRWGKKMGDVGITDALTNILSDPFERYAMGTTAENVAFKYEISREEQDEYALKSQHKAIEAIDNGVFKEQIIPIKVTKKRGVTEWLETDEYPKRNSTMENLSKLKPVFKKDGTVTAGNSSGINDGASSMILMKESEAKKRGLKIMGSVKSYAFVGVEPSLMGIGPIPSVKKALEIAGLSLEDIGLIESNEAFAAQCIAVSKELKFNEEIVNVNGGAIALGHPVGATGNILTLKLLNEMNKREIQYGLVTLCIGGGQGCAVIFERDMREQD